ncbi:hypothetical protein JNUCC64_30615 [Streptomyces sp. JNUCC 64]
MPLYISIDYGETPSVDNGTRPYTGARALWDNNSITLSGGVSDTQTRVDLPTTVKVRVSNSGREPVEDVRVDAYVMNPFVGLAHPAQAMVRLRSGLVTVPPGSGATGNVVECLVPGVEGEPPHPWKPTVEELGATQGHSCLEVNAYADGDGAPLPDGGDFDIPGNPHHGQRNITLLPAETGTRAPQLVLQVMPPPEWAEEPELTVEQVRGARALGAGERALLASHPAVTVVTGEDGRTRLLVADGNGDLVPVHLSRRKLRVDLDLGGDPCGERTALPHFTEPTIATVTLASLTRERAGAAHVVDIVQRAGGTARGCGPRIIGGQRIIGLVTGPELG